MFRRRSIAAANGIAVMIGAALFSMFFFQVCAVQRDGAGSEGLGMADAAASGHEVQLAAG